MDEVKDEIVPIDIYSIIKDEFFKTLISNEVWTMAGYTREILEKMSVSDYVAEIKESTWTIDDWARFIDVYKERIKDRLLQEAGMQLEDMNIPSDFAYAWDEPCSTSLIKISDLIEPVRK